MPYTRPTHRVHTGAKKKLPKTAYNCVTELTNVILECLQSSITKRTIININCETCSNVFNFDCSSSKSDINKSFNVPRNNK